MSVPLRFYEKYRGWDAAQWQGRGKYLNFGTASRTRLQRAITAGITYTFDQRVTSGLAKRVTGQRATGQGATFGFGGFGLARGGNVLRPA